MADSSTPAATPPAEDPSAIGFAADESPHHQPHKVGRKIVRGALTYGVIFLAVWFLIKNLQSSDDLSGAVKLITWWQVVIICILGLLNLATNWPPLVVALPGLRYPEAAVTNTASAALSNTIPEGGAAATGLNYAMLRSWGFTLKDITNEMLVTGTWSQFTKYILLAVGMVIVVLHGEAKEGAIWVALGIVAVVAIAIVLLGLILRSEKFARRLGQWIDAIIGHVMGWFHRPNPAHMTTAVPDFRTSMVSLLRVCWQRLTLAEVVSQLTAVFVLGVACRMQGLDESTINWAVILVAWGAMTFASLIVPTPGGIGVAEITLVGVLSYGLSDSLTPAIIGAVLLYRIATFLLPIPIGLCTYLYWRNSSSWKKPKNVRGPNASRVTVANGAESVN